MERNEQRDLGFKLITGYIVNFRSAWAKTLPQRECGEIRQEEEKEKIGGREKGNRKRDPSTVRYTVCT